MLEEISLDPFVAGVVALLGVVVGLVLGRFLLPGPREIKRLRSEIERLGIERAEYQHRVAVHFERTGDLIGQMTASYKAVYDHLAEGVQTLCAAEALSKPVFTPRLIIDETVTVDGTPVRATQSSETARMERAAAPAFDREEHALDVTAAPAVVPAADSSPSPADPNVARARS